jgi:hypothetical protein
MAGRVGYDGGRDLACVVQGLRKVVCEPLVVWLCVDPQPFVHFSELILGREVRLNSHIN